MKKTYCFDIDGTICSEVEGAQYEKAKLLESPDRFRDKFPYRKDMNNHLYDLGHKIIYLTARGTTTGIDWRKVTEAQLKEWGVKYHELHFGKPEADFFIDDKASFSMIFYNKLFEPHIDADCDLEKQDYWRLRVSVADIYGPGGVAEGHN